MTLAEMPPVERHVTPADVYVRPKLTRSKLYLASRALDETINRLHETFPPAANKELFQRDARHFQHALTTTDRFLHDSRHHFVDDNVAYYGLLARRALAIESVVLPAVYTQPQPDELLADILDGTGGKTVRLLEDALDRYDQARPSLAKLQLAGAIGELQFLSMANRREDGRLSAVPAALREDLLRRTDAYVFHRSPANNKAYRVPVQVKSTHENVAAVNGIGINGEDMSSSAADGFLAARALTRLYSGKALTPQESDMLEQADRRFHAAISQKLAAVPGTPLR